MSREVQDSNLKVIADLFAMILKVANEHRHMMTHIAYIHPEKGQQEIVSIWAGSGIGAEPTKRIKELLEENSRLKFEISQAIDKTKI